MAVIFYFVAALACAHAAPPAPPRLFPHHAPAQLQQINPLDYYLDNPDVGNYYNHAQQKQENENSASNSAPARLETLEPDSEVELIPGAQQPQPPQQTPVAPNLPGLIPGQRVFIVHMPVPGYRPGTISGYQPVYIVAAAPQGQPGYAANGYQNGFLLDPSGQAVISPLVGYPRTGLASQNANPGVVFGAAPLTLNRPFEQLVYPDHAVAYQAVPVAQGAEGTRGTIRLSQVVGLQGQPSPKASGNGGTSNSESKRVAQESENESKEAQEEPRRSPRPAQSQTRVKA